MWDGITEIVTDLVTGGIVVANLILLGAVVIALTVEGVGIVRKYRVFTTDVGGSLGGFGKEFAKDIVVMLGTAAVGAIPIVVFANWEYIKSIVSRFILDITAPLA